MSGLKESRPRPAMVTRVPPSTEPSVGWIEEISPWAHRHSWVRLKGGISPGGGDSRCEAGDRGGCLEEEAHAVLILPRAPPDDTLILYVHVQPAVSCRRHAEGLPPHRVHRGWEAGWG